MELNFEDDCNLSLECAGLMYYLKYSHKKRVFSINDICKHSKEDELIVKRILKRLMGHGYVTRSYEKGD